MNAPTGPIARIESDSTALRRAERSVPRGMIQGHRRPMWRLVLFCAVAVAPALAMLGYALLIGSPVYMSEVSFAIRSREGNTSISGFGAITQNLGIGLTSGNDIYAVRAFLGSQEALDYLEKSIGYGTEIDRARGDPVLRLSPSATAEEMLNRFHWMMPVRLSSIEQIVTVKARAFDRKLAQQAAAESVAAAEIFVNRMNARANRDFVGFANDEVVRAERRVAATRLAITDWRNTNASIDPTKYGDMVQAILQALEGELAKTRADIAETRLSPTDVGPRVRSLRNREKALEEQIKTERTRLTGEMSAVTGLLSEYERLLIERDLADKQYAAAVEAVKAARQEVSQQQKYIVVVSEPSVAEQVEFPRPILHTAAVCLLGFILYGILIFGHAVLRDYRQR